MKHLLSLICVCVFLSPAMVYAAKYNKPFMVEVHIGPSAPSESMGDVDVDAGFNFGTSVSYLFLNDLLGVYMDIGIDGFDADSPSIGELESVVLSSYGVGMLHQGSFSSSRLGYFVRVGLHNSQLVLLDDDSDDIDETRYEIGFQSSAGLTFNLAKNWALRGGLQFKTFSKPLKATNTGKDAELESLALTFGGSFRF